MATLYQAKLEARLEEEALIRAEIAALDLPAGVRFHRMVPYTDWGGEETWKIEFAFSKGLPTPDRRVRVLREMKHTLSERLIDLRLGNLPVIRLVDEK